MIQLPRRLISHYVEQENRNEMRETAGPDVDIQLAGSMSDEFSQSDHNCEGSWVTFKDWLLDQHPQIIQ